MPGSIQKRGENKYLLTISGGTGVNGKRIRYTRTVEAKSDREARKLLALFEAEVETGKIKDDGKLTLEQYAKFWIKEYAEKRLARRTVDEYKRLLKRINIALGHIRLSKLKPHHLTQFYNMLREEGMRGDGKPGRLTESTIAHYHRLLSVILETAMVESDLIPENPCKKVKDKPKAEKKTVKYYNEEQVIKLFHAIQDAPIKYRVAITLLLFTGLRRGELLGLEWDDIDFDNCEISVKRTSLYTTEEGIFEDDPKTESSKRTISVPIEVIELLKEYKAWQNEQRLKKGDKWHDYNRLFTQHDGKPMHPSTLNNWMRKNLFSKIDLPRISPHALRHTHISLLLANNVDIITAAFRAGHADKNTTINIYAHAFKEKDKKAATVLSNVLFKKSN